MASTENSKNINFSQGADLSSDTGQNRALKLDANGRVVLTAAATDIMVGMIGEESADAVIGSGISMVTLVGKVKMIAAAAISIGDVIVPAAAGQVNGVANIGALAADSMGVGIALTAAGAQGDILQVFAMTIAAPHSV